MFKALALSCLERVLTKLQGISSQMPDAPQTQIELLYSDITRPGSRCAFGTPV